MSTESLFNDIREEVRRIVPSDLDITSIEFEGPTVVVYTKDFDKFADNPNLTKTLANSLKKRVDIRPDPSSLKDSDEVEKKIREMVPDVDIAGFYFDFDTGGSWPRPPYWPRATPPTGRTSPCWPSCPCSTPTAA